MLDVQFKYYFSSLLVIESQMEKTVGKKAEAIKKEMYREESQYFLDVI